MQLLVLLALLAAPPLADDTTYQEGLRLHEEFEFERAVFRFEEALRDKTRAPADRAVIHVRLGMTRAELRDDARAVQSFQDALLLDPYVTLPADASPKIRTLLDEARVEVRNVREMPVKPVETEPVTPVEPLPALTPAPAAPVEQSQQVPDDVDDGSSVLLYTGVALLGVGAVTFIVAAATWGAGTGIALYANTLTYQDEAGALVLPSMVAQVGGQVALAVAAVIVLAGVATTTAHVVIGE